MSETMTLEELRSLVRQSPVAGVDVGALEVGIDAAIRGRDALRHAIAVEVDIGKIADTLHAERDKHRARAEKAEAELAALRKRIAEAPVVSGGDIAWGCGVAREWTDKRVRLLVVEDGDA